MDLATLDRPVADLASEIMASDLRAINALLDAESELLKRRKAVFAALMLRKFEAKAREALAASGKDTGTVHVAANDGEIKVEFPKEVEWDQAKLYAALDTMSPQDAKHYAKVEVKVDERKFTAAPPAIQAALAPARTVKVGKPKFSFKTDKAEAA